MQEGAATACGRYRSARHGHVRRSGRRFQCLCQWRMDQGHAHSRRQTELRHRRNFGRRDPEAHPDPHSGSGPGRICRQRGHPQNRRFLRQLHGRSGHRVEGNRSPEAATRYHRGHRGSARSRPRAGRAASRGRRPAEQYQLRDPEPLRSLGHAGPDGPVAQLSLPAPRRSRNAGPRLLSLRNSAYGRVAQAVPGAYRGNVQAGGL